MSNKTQPARGMRDFLPADIRKRNYVIGIIKSVYESYGFEPLETPAVENLETLTGKYGEEGGQLMYKILKRGEKLDVSSGEKGLADLALRYDLTVPLARVVANNKNELPKFFKRYQIQPVWRADRPAKGRFREFYQCDVDAIGSNSMIVEAELISAVSEILERLGFDDFIIWINNRKLLTGILEGSNFLEDEITDVLVSLDKLDKIGKEGVLNELERKGISKNQIEELIKFIEIIEFCHQEFDRVVNNSSIDQNHPNLEKSNNQIFNDVIIKLLKDPAAKVNESGLEGLKEIEFIIKTIDSSGLTRLRVNPALARGLSYYTGAIFEINVPDLAGSLGGGGRYDGLIGMFGKEQIPACGFSLGLERIIVVMEERGMFPAELRNNAADVLVTIWNEESIGESLKLANDLRAQDLRVLIYPEADKLGKQFKYASQINIPFVCVLGETELAENKVTLKNMLTGEQETVAREETASKIKQ